MNEKSNEKYLFKTSQFLGPPSIFPPHADGELSVALKFIVTNLKIGSKDAERNISILAKKCGINLYGFKLEKAKNERTNKPATLVTFAYI